MGMMSVQKHIGLLVFLLVFVFSLNPQPSVCSSSSNTTLIPNNSPLMLCHPLQSHALLQFISTLFTIDIDTSWCGYGSYPKTESWKEGTDCCSSWDGVTCNAVTGHVIGLDLSCSKLAGIVYSNNSLFSTHIAPYLQRLNLAGNEFRDIKLWSKFGVKFGSTLTHLNLSNSGFSGNIPSNIVLLSNLVSLDLSNNLDLRVKSDRVLENIARNLTHLKVLSLDWVNMSSIHASSLMNLSSSLTSLHLSECELQGEFPVSFLVYPNLEELDLSYNNFNPAICLPYSLNSTTPTSRNLWFLDLTSTTFSLSSSIALLGFVGNHLKSLGTLFLINCNISGSIPPSFGNLTKLTYFDLSHNHLSGPIPTFISNLTHLTHLILDSNELEGPLPSYLFALQFLTIVDLSNNKLHGQIPTSPIDSNLTDLNLSNNSLSGLLDFDVFLSFNKLTHLDLSKNNISSTISASASTNFSLSLPSFESLDLSGCNLNRFPTFIKALTNLTRLLVSNSQIKESIPDWIYDVGKYTLYMVDLSDNYLTGVIGHLDGWKRIRSISIDSNLLQGSLPIPTMVTYFDVSNNNLSGVISSSICNLSSLYFFDLSNNHVTGSIPHCLVNMTSLWILDLGMNELHGVIPNTFATDSQLRSIVLKGNQLTGPIPPSLADCASLRLLDLGNNKFEDKVPHWLKKLSSLEILILRSNKFFGSLNNFKPTFFPPSLRILDLSNNNFDGKLPIKLLTVLTALTNAVQIGFITGDYIGEDLVYYSMVIAAKGSELEYVKILSTFAVIDLSRNKFAGQIPKEIGKLVSLKGLNLSHNSLTGHIPSSMGNLASLEWLDLSSNKLNGEIPKELTNMTFLSVLNLSHNQLDGPIPQGKQFDTFTNDSYRDNLALCGLPLSKSCGLPPSAASENKESSDSESGFNWAVAFSGYGCGIILGLSIGYIMFETGAPKWFVRIVDRKKQRGRVGQRSRRSCGRRRN